MRKIVFTKKHHKYSNWTKLIASNFVIGAVQAFPRYFVVVGFVLFFLPGHIPSNAGFKSIAFVWIVYLLTPFLLWKLFDRWDRAVQRFFDGRNR